MLDPKDAAKRAKDHLHYLQEEFWTTYEDNVHLCESPIEAMMLIRLIGLQTGYSWAQSNAVVSDLKYVPDHIYPQQIWIVPQHKAGKYRVDFLVCLGVDSKDGKGPNALFAVECDGHDFHEKTKEQAARDKARDRYLNSRGLTVFRYTGSEIFKNESGLLDDLQIALDNKIEESWGLVRGMVA